MSEEYEDDFENAYEEDFESDEEPLEVPALLQPQQQQLKQDLEQEVDCHDAPPPASTASQLDTRLWPSLSTSLRSPPSKGRRPAGPAMFTRPLFAAGAGLMTSSSGGAGGPHTSASGSDTRITLQPPLPPLDDAQRRQAAVSLQRSRQLQQQPGFKLQLSTQLDLLVLQPLSLYQQYSRGVGVYAGRSDAACQTRQLEQDIREQDVQTEQIEQQTTCCQAPEDLYSSGRKGPQRQQQQQQPGAPQQPHCQQLPTALLATSDPAFAEFLEWAVAQVLLELRRAEAEAAAESSLATAAAGPAFGAVQTAQQASTTGSSRSSSAPSPQPLLSGELQLLTRSADGLLAGRPVVGLAGPPTPQAAAAAAAAIATATAAAAAVSSHLLLACYGPAALPAAGAAAAQHDLSSLGCLCVWDLLTASTQPPPAAAGAAAPAVAGGQAGGSCELPHGVLQLLVSEGRPTCCCWGAGEGAATLVFAGMEEGGICCWDLAERDSACSASVLCSADTQDARSHPASALPARRPSYSTEAPLVAGTGWATAAAAAAAADSTTAAAVSSSSGDAGGTLLQDAAAWLAAGGVVALASVSSARSGGSSSSQAGGGSSGSGGPVCRLVVLGAGGCVTLYSVMLGGAGSDVAVTDLGMRTGSRVWLVKVCEGLPLGMDVVKPPHMKQPAAPGSSSSSNRQQQEVSAGFSLLLLPGAAQQLLVGSAGGRVLKGAGLGAAVTTPPHTYTSVQWWPGAGAAPYLESPHAADTSAVQDAGCGVEDVSEAPTRVVAPLPGAVTSLAACPLLPEVWLAGHSCGRLALFSLKRSRPAWVWQHPQGAPVVAVRWLPRSCAFTAAFDSSSSSNSSSGTLVAFHLASSLRQPAAVVALCSPQHSNYGGDGSAAAVPGALQPEAAGMSTGVAPCCMEVLSVSASCCSAADSSSQGPAAAASRSLSKNSSSSSSARRGEQGPRGKVVVAVGFSDGCSCCYQVAGGWCQAAGQQELEALQGLVASC